MPQMGFDMQEGTLVRWLVSEGADVSVGDPIAEIETDKAVVEYEATAEGVLRRIVVPEGTTVPVGQAIAIVGTADEEIADAVGVEGPAPSPTPPKPPPAAIAPVVADEPAASPGPAPEASQVRASPIARRLAEEKGIDLSQVTGTGPGNRVTRDDVLAYTDAHPEGPPAKAASPAPAPAPAAAATAASAAPGEKAPLSRMRQQIARVTSKSKRESPHFYVSADVDMTAAMGMRKQLNQELESEGVRITVNDLVLKACIGGLKKYPKFNAFFEDDALRMNDSINIGIAIAEEQGLIVPAVMSSGGMSLRELSTASADLIQRAQSGTLQAQEYTGGTFSTSNLGMFDVTSFAAIILPPQSAMLAVGTVSKRPVVRGDDIAVADVMTATVSVDHRVADGAEGARFLNEVKRLLENPTLLLL